MLNFSWHFSTEDARVLFHNTATTPIIFRTETWHQNDKHSASGTGVPPVSQEPSVTPKSVDLEASVSADGREAHAAPTGAN